VVGDVDTEFEALQHELQRDLVEDLIINRQHPKAGANQLGIAIWEVFLGLSDPIFSCSEVLVEVEDGGEIGHDSLLSILEYFVGDLPKL
jgi:hypothetical protein